MYECICVGSIDNKPLLLDTDALLQTLAVTTAGLSYCYLSTASNKSSILTSDISAASSSSSLDVVSVFSANPRDGSDAVGIPAAQWQFVKHRKTSDPSDTKQPHSPRSKSLRVLVFSAARGSELQRGVFTAST